MKFVFIFTLFSCFFCFFLFLMVTLQCWLNIWFSSLEPKLSFHFCVSDSQVFVKSASWDKPESTSFTLALSCCASCLRYRAGVPGCGQRRTSSDPRRAPPRGCRGWSAVAPASPASHAHVPAAQRSKLYLKTTQRLMWLSPQQSQKYHLAAFCYLISSSFKQQSSFRSILFLTCNRILPQWALSSRLSYRMPVICLSGNR